MANLSFLESSLHHPASLSKTDATKLENKKIGNLKGNSNFQGILNWILQIAHYYCRKQHKNNEDSQIIE